MVVPGWECVALEGQLEHHDFLFVSVWAALGPFLETESIVKAEGLFVDRNRIDLGA